MNRLMQKIFLNERVILTVILLNAVVIYLNESGFTNGLLLCLDISCTLFFVAEMIVKQVQYGCRRYWQSGWNRLDGVLVILSLPSLIVPFLDINMFNFSTVILLRLLRVIRFARVFHLFPNITKTLSGLKRAIRDSGVIVICFIIAIIIIGLINCSLYKEVAPEYFSTPLDSIYTVFRIFTIEGWYEVPDAIAAATAPWIGKLSRLYFCLILSLFGILGMSFINSVFVDAMVEDNNDDVKEQLKRLEEKIDQLSKKIK